MKGLKDAATRINRATRLWNELVSVVKPWLDNDGIRVELHQDPALAQDTWVIGKTSEPAQPIEALCADILGNLRSALDMIAWQIFVQGGGDPDSKAAKSVYFPIVEDESDWLKQLKQKVPTAWPEAVEALLASQPFKQEIVVQRSALPVLHGMNNPDKHRNLSLIATDVTSVYGIFPGLPDDLTYIVTMAKPGPTIELKVGHELGSLMITRDDPDTGQPLPILRNRAPTMPTPEPPTYDLALRNGDYEMVVLAIPDLMTHVREIYSRFAALESPS